MSKTQHPSPENENPGTVWIVKLGGSLFGIPELAKKLSRLTETLGGREYWIVPGGGRFVDELRRLALLENWSQETAHRLALRAMSLTAHVLAESSPGWEVVQGIPEPVGQDQKRFCILDVTSLPEVETLPATWDLTSDSIAAWIAVRFGSGKLLLGKSTDFPETCHDWTEPVSKGLIDPLFPESGTGLTQIEWANFRVPIPACHSCPVPMVGN